MKIENGIIVEATESELMCLYFERGYFDYLSFNEYCAEMTSRGCVVRGWKSGSPKNKLVRDS